jgi:hypothetical protein
MRKWLYASAIAAGILFFGAAPAQAAPTAPAAHGNGSDSPLDGLLGNLPIGQGLNVNGLPGGALTGGGSKGAGSKGGGLTGNGGLTGGGLPIESAHKLPDASVVRTIASTDRDRRFRGRNQVLGLDLFPGDGGLLGNGHRAGKNRGTNLLGSGQLLGGLPLGLG